MLPKGVLAKHGYDVKYGFFNGTCWGAGHKPFETGFDCLEKAVEWAQEHVRHIQSEILKTEAETVKLPFHRYLSGALKNGVWLKSGYYWETVILSQADSAGILINFEDGTSEPAFRYAGLGYTMEEIAAHLKGRRVAAYRKDIQSRKEYITWQKGRILNWRPQPLKEVK